MAFLKRKTSVKKEKETRAEQGVSVVTNQGSSQVKTGVILYPHVTEKTAGAASRGMYAFAIAPFANKWEVKKAVESRYGVMVTDVRMVTIQGKEVRRGKQIGRKPGIKKAYVTLAKGQKIEIQ